MGTSPSNTSIPSKMDEWMGREEGEKKEKNLVKDALQGNRTPANCLEGNYPTTGPAMRDRRIIAAVNINFIG